LPLVQHTKPLAQSASAAQLATSALCVALTSGGESVSTPQPATKPPTRAAAAATQPERNEAMLPILFRVLCEPTHQPNPCRERYQNALDRESTDSFRA
jgi:hypothetical protein